LMRRRWRNIAVIVLALACTAATIHLFSWPDILRALADADYVVLLLGGGGLLLTGFAVRGLRWLLVVGIEPRPRKLLRSGLANGAAAGFAILTPFQLGEVLKVRLAPQHAEGGWRHGVSGFMVERVLDLSCLLGIGLSGLA